MSDVQILGRSSSHFTRVTRIFALELEVSFELVPVFDLARTDADAYFGNPALKVPVLKRAGAVVFGTENICRALFELSLTPKRVVWPEQLRSDVSRNAQELVWHCMAAQVQLITGTIVAKLPAESPHFAKVRAGFEGALRWLDAHLAGALSSLPSERDLSLFEVSLFCLIEHLSFRETLSTEPYPALVAFAREFAKRSSAQKTPYQFDTPPKL